MAYSVYGVEIPAAVRVSQSQVLSRTKRRESGLTWAETADNDHALNRAKLGVHTFFLKLQMPHFPSDRWLDTVISLPFLHGVT